MVATFLSATVVRMFMSKQALQRFEIDSIEIGAVIVDVAAGLSDRTVPDVLEGRWVTLKDQCASDVIDVIDPVLCHHAERLVSPVERQPDMPVRVALHLLQAVWQRRLPE